MVPRPKVIEKHLFINRYLYYARLQSSLLHYTHVVNNRKEIPYNLSPLSSFLVVVIVFGCGIRSCSVATGVWPKLLLAFVVLVLDLCLILGELGRVVGIVCKQREVNIRFMFPVRSQMGVSYVYV